MLGSKIASSEGRIIWAVPATGPVAQELVAEGPVWAHWAVRGGGGAVGIFTGSTSIVAHINIHTGGRRARAAVHVGAVFRAVVGGAGDLAAVIVDVVALRCTEGDEIRALEI